MADMLYGGAGLLHCYRVEKSGSAYVIKTPDGSGTAADTDDVALALAGFIEQTQLQPQSDGTFKVVLDNYDVAEEVIDWLNTWAKKSGSSGGTAPAGVKMEHGIEQGAGGGATDKWILWISYGPLNAAGTKRLMHYGLATADMSSGAITFKDGQWIKPVITLNSVSAEYALSIIAALFAPTMLNAATIGTQTVALNSHYEREYLAKAA
jgi:hypothetical protein